MSAARRAPRPVASRQWVSSHYPVHASPVGPPAPPGAPEVVGVASLFEEVDEPGETGAVLDTLVAARAQTLALLDTLIAAAPVGFAVLDRELRYQRVNPAFAEINGLPAAAYVGRTVREVVPDLADQAESLLRRVLATGTPIREVEVSGEVPGHPGVQRHRVESVFPVPGADPSVVALAVIVWENTERKRAEVEQARLLAAEQAARAEADRARAQAERVATRLALLQSLTARLAAAQNPSDVLEVIGSDALAMLGASLANVSVLDEATGRMTLVAAVNTPDAVTSEFATYPLEAPLPSWDAIRSGAPVLLGSIAERDRRYPVLAHVRVDQQAFAVLPLTCRGRTVGVVGFGWTEPRVFSAAEVGLLETIAGQCAAALDRARVHEAEHHVAETLQRSLLPSQLPRLRDLTLAARYCPAAGGAQVGGDWYDALPLGARRAGLVLGDVSGHGVAAAALMGQMRQVLRAEARTGDSPGVVLARLNTAVFDLADNGERIVTCCYLQVDQRDALLRLAVAGHPPPLLLTNGEAVRLSAATGPPLGVLRSARYVEQTVILPRGATMLLYSDGLVERRGEALDEGLHRLERVARAGPAHPDQLCDRLLRELSDPAADDDIALLVARFDPTRFDPTGFDPTGL